MKSIIITNYSYIVINLPMIGSRPTKLPTIPLFVGTWTSQLK